MPEECNLIDRISKIPVEIDEEEEYLIIPEDKINEILTKRRIQIIELLREQNPFTEQKLCDLFGEDIHKDLVILRHLKLINIKKIDENQKHNIITLNRNMRII